MHLKNETMPEEKFQAIGIWLILNVYAPLAISLLLRERIFAMGSNNFIFLGSSILIIIFNVIAASKYRSCKMQFYTTAFLNLMSILYLGVGTMPMLLFDIPQAILIYKTYSSIITGWM
jgi:hypothetical protein